MTDDFNFFSDKDREDISYGACVGSSALMGAAVGRFVGLTGLLGGAVTGLAIGMIACKRIFPAIERKMFSSNERLTDQELLQILRVVRDETGVNSKSDAMQLLGYARYELAQKGPSIKSEKKAYLPMRIAASLLLSKQV